MAPGMKHLFVQNYMEQCLKIYIRNARTDRYNPMCYIDARNQHNTSSVDDGSSGGGNSLPSNSTT